MPRRHRRAGHGPRHRRVRPCRRLVVPRDRRVRTVRPPPGTQRRDSSVSLTDEDVALLDEYARTSGLTSRSAVVRRALRLLRHPDLEQDYAAAWEEWAG